MKSEVDAATRPPVDVVLAGHEPLLHQIPTQRRVVVVEGTEQSIDLPLRIAHADLEHPADVVEHYHSLRVLHRDLRQPPAAKKSAEHCPRARVDITDVVRFVARPR